MSNDGGVAGQTDSTERDELFERWAAHPTPELRNEIAESFAPLAEFFANRYKNRGAEPEDLRQVAHLALVAAVDRFDPAYGVKFSTFAGRTIDGELKKYFRDKTWAVRVPRGLKEISIEVRNAADRFNADHDRAPKVHELAELTGHSDDVIIEALDVQATAYRAESLNKPAGDGDGLTLGETLESGARGIEVAEIQLAVRSMLDELPERERTIVLLRFFENKSQQEIADQIGVSQMHVSRLLRTTLQELREKLR
ncbi:MAG: SigB/SigF/SigG family RNA polymerase sigma factor [Acidimicrobiia bacterium]|nr:SigB/SigF/SigG family RNA polymerase sigma factor [Acidimicrobiia bacterium]